MADTPSPETYPPALPDELSDDLAEREARLKRWSRVFVAVMLAALAATAGFGYYLIKIANDRHSELQALANAAKQTTAVESVAKDDMSARSAKEGETQRERFLDLLDNLVGAHLYQCYLNIGLLADCTESDLYSEDEAEHWLDRVLMQMEQVDQRLEKLGKVDLDAEERKGVERCRHVSALLRLQAKELKEYWKNSDKDHAARYHKAREEAWTELSDVLDLPREADEPIEPKSDTKPKEDAKAKEDSKKNMREDGKRKLRDK